MKTLIAALLILLLAGPLWAGQTTISLTGTGGAASWQTAFDYSSGKEAEGEGAGYGGRIYIPANTSSYSGSKIRITGWGGATVSMNPDVTAICETSATDFPNCCTVANCGYDRTPTQIYWDTGSADTTIAATETKVSDETTFTFDKTKAYSINYHYGYVPGDNGSYKNTPTGFKVWLKGNDTNSLNQTVTTGTTYSDVIAIFLKLEVYTP